MLNWAGETLISLAESSDASDTPTYYERAAEAFEALLAAAPNADPPVQPDLQRQAKLRLASANRHLKQHQKAIDLLEEVLLEKNTLLNVQAEAALTYEEAGEFGELKLFDYAIKGRPEESCHR